MLIYNDIIPNYFDNLSIFLDINTICNLNCNYCCSRLFKDWNKEIDMGHILKLNSIFKTSNYNINLVLFGGEPLLHSKIEEIIEIFKTNQKISNIIILSNGINSNKNLYQLNNIYYGLTLHELTLNQFDIFTKNILNIDQKFLKINIPLNPKNPTISLFMDFLKINPNYTENVILSLLYDNSIKSIYTIEELKQNIPELLLNLDNKFNNKSLLTYLPIHFDINPDRDIKLCNFNELNIDIDGNINSSCFNINDNIYKNPLLLKKINLGIKCHKNECFDCTGTITCPKEFIGEKIYDFK